jgi:hypothetical protein
VGANREVEGLWGAVSKGAKMALGRDLKEAGRELRMVRPWAQKSWAVGFEPLPKGGWAVRLK